MAKTNGVLFIAVIILSLIAWFQPGLHPIIHHYLTTLAAQEVKTILLERQDIGSIKLKKHENGWFLEEPFKLPANPLRVKTIAALAEKRSYSKFESTTQNLKRYHLDKPFVSVWLNETKITLGSEDPINSQRYAMNIKDNIMTDKNQVHLINGVIFYQLRANIDTFISPLFLPPSANIQSISWSDKQLTINKGRWELSAQSAEAHADLKQISADSIAQLIQAWQKGEAKKVETNVSFDITNEQLLQSPSITIYYTPFNSAPVSPDLGNQNSTSSDPQKLNLQTKVIQYLVTQDGKQLKLFRPDIQIAYWISPQKLKQLTELSPLTTDF